MEAYIDTGILVLAVVGGFTIIASLLIYFLKYLDDKQEKKNRKAREEQDAIEERLRLFNRIERIEAKLECLEREIGSMPAYLFANKEKGEI